MAAPSGSDRRGLVVGLGLVVALALGVSVLSLVDPTRPALESTSRVADSSSAWSHGTRPARLVARDVARVAAAFGIRAQPERVEGGWEAEDEVRSLYLLRSPSAWYVSFEDASTLLQPAGDRATVCSVPEAPFACTLPDVEIVADAGAAPPDATTAARVARRTLSRAGLLAGRWTTVVLDASTDVPPCRATLATEFDCTRQVVPTRAVMLTRDFGPGATAARFGVVVGPRGNVLTVTGRAAEPRRD